MLNSYFAMEVCARYEAGGRLHETLRRQLADHPSNATHQQKWTFYKRCSFELLNGLSIVERGCWDYYNDDARAKKDYAQWVAGMTTEEGARTTPSGDDPYRGEPRFMTFTMAFLILQDSACDLAMRKLCDIPEPALWRRSTFQHILSGLNVLNFAAIESDVAYLIPRDAGWGLTVEDLAQPKFQYLRMLES